MAKATAATEGSPIQQAVAAALAKGGITALDPEKREAMRQAAIAEEQSKSAFVQEARRLAREVGIGELLENAEKERPDIASIALLTVADLGLRILGGEFQFKDAGQAASVMRSMFDIYRLETGKATQLTEMSEEERDRRLAEIRERAQGRSIPTTAA